MAREGSAGGRTEPSAASATSWLLGAVTRAGRRVGSICRRRPILAAAAVGTIAVLLAAAVVGPSGPGAEPRAGGSSRAVPRAVPASLAELASATGCSGFAVEIEGKDYRRARCGESPGNRYWLLTFLTYGNAQDWLEGSRAYGGVYLVGVRWIITGPRSVLESFQQKLGGTVQTGGG